MSRPQSRQRKPGMTPEQITAAELAAAADRDHYAKTRHCGQCCRPGTTCTCSKAHKCGCWIEHDGNRDRAAVVESVPLFADPGPRIPKRTAKQRAIN